MDLSVLAELDRRGILPPEKAPLLVEARRRGLVSGEQAAEANSSVATDTSGAEQFGSGANEGLASLAGLPVDLMTGALNLGISGINKVAGTELGAIEDPVGGSASLTGALSPFISEVEPQTSGQRFMRRAGQEVGASAIPAAGLISKASRPLQALALEGASSAGATVAGHVADEAGAGDGVQAIASLIGGGVPIMGAMAARKGPQAPTLDELKAEQASAYGNVEASGAALTETARDRVVAALKSRLADEGNPEFLENVVRRYDGKIDKLSPNPTVMDVEDMRRGIGNDIAGHSDRSTRRLGVDMKGITDDTLDGLTSADVLSGDPDAAVSSLKSGRDLTRRISSAEMVGEALEKAERRAASSGTGGNEVNAIRQNIRSILDSPAKRRGLSADEIEKMEGIVRGTPAVNGLRLAGRMSPTAGALPAMGGLTSAGVFGPLGAVPSAAGYISKGMAEMMTHRQVNQLDEMIRNGGPIGKKVMSDAEKRVVASLLATSAADAQ